MKKTLLWLVAFLAFPLAMQAADQLFYVSFASRVMIYALAATRSEERRVGKECRL